MKRLAILLLTAAILLASSGCNAPQHNRQIAATTLPVYAFTSILCEETDIHVARLITESVSCLHDYTLQVSQMRILEESDAVIISGAGLEDFLGEALHSSKKIIDASKGISLLCAEPDASHGHDHDHDHDPHIWLDPTNAQAMAANICQDLICLYPEYTEVFRANLQKLNNKLDELRAYASEQLATLGCREIITFHDGFSYMAQAFDLTILHALEEESGSEASAAELIALCELVNGAHIPAIFTERNGSTSAAGIVARETGVRVYTLDMAMSGDSYFDAMYDNIDTLKEALG